VSPLFLFTPYVSLLLAFLFVWGMVVVADSPMFSTLVAQHAPIASRGSTLTMVNCIGFSITIVSIQLLSACTTTIDPRYIYMLLGVGPALGLLGLYRYGSAKVDPA
jgi:MFS family permease